MSGFYQRILVVDEDEGEGDGEEALAQRTQRLDQGDLQALLRKAKQKGQVM